MTAPTLRFEISEIELGSRRSESMQRDDVDLLIVTAPQTWHGSPAMTAGHSMHQCVLVRQDEDPIWFGREMDAKGARRTVYMDESRIKSHGDQYVQSSQYHPMTALGSLIADLGWSKGVIGVRETTTISLTRHLGRCPKCFQMRCSRIPPRLVKWQRIVKSPRKIEYMRAAGKIATAIISG